MSTTTTTYGFGTPVAGTEEDTWGDIPNANWDKADDLLDGTEQIKCLRLTTLTMSGTALSPDAGQIQTLTLSGNVTLTDSLADGDQMMLRVVNGDTHTVTWPTLSWVGVSAAPTLTGDDWVSLWKVGSTLFASYTGAVI